MQSEKPLMIIGVKPNNSYFHNTMRIVAMFILIVILIMLYLSDHKPHKKITSIHDIEDVVRPGTKLYEAIMEMDEDARVVYISSMNKVLHNSDDIPKFRKILKTVLTTLFVAFVAEYIIHGNVSKVMSTTGKTSLSATLTALT